MTKKNYTLSFFSISITVPSLPPLDHPGQPKPTAHHGRKQSHADRMQHPRPHLLRQEPREEGRHRSPRAAERRHGGQAAHLQPLGDELREDGGGARVDGPEEEADDGDGDGLADDVGHEPDEQLEGGGAGDEADDGALLAEAVGRVREEEAAERDAGPEARGDVTHAPRRRVPVRDEEGDDPAGDGDLGALVAEDEEGAEHGRLVREGGLEELGAGGGGRVRVRRGRVEGVRGWVVGFEGAVGEEAEDEVGERHGDGDGVEGRPGVVVGDQRRRDQRADRGADAVGPVEAAERGGRVGQVGREDVVRGQVRGYAPAEEEEGDDDDGEGGPADQHDVGRQHGGLGQHERLGPAQAGLQDLADGSGGDEADGVGDEDERDDRVAYVVVLFHVGDEGTRGGVVQSVAEIHETSTQESPLVDRRVRPRLNDFGGVVILRAQRAGHLQVMETPWRLGTHWCCWYGRGIIASDPAQFVQLECGW